MSASKSPDENSKRAWFEPVTAILMAVASLSTAWFSYQSSRWSGQSSGFATAADKFEKEAAELHLAGQQIESVQMSAVMEVIDAKLEGDELSSLDMVAAMNLEARKGRWGGWLDGL
jgi:hypothetical protein